MLFGSTRLVARMHRAVRLPLSILADVIIFDEATSALDNKTEQAVMQSIESLGQNLTILIIAHRLTTLKNCTQIVELADGGIKRIGTYEEIVGEDNLLNSPVQLSTKNAANC